MPEEAKSGDSVGPRGRPRDPGRDRLILEGTLKLLAERGFGGLSIEGVAAESGVAKTTIYRRYDSKIDLVIDATLTLLQVDETPDTGTLKGDLLWLMNRPRVMEMLSGQGATVIGSMLAEKTRNPELLEVFRERLVGPRMGQIHRVFERAQARREIKTGIDHRLIGMMLFGSLLAHSLTGAELSEAEVRRVIDVLVDGIGRPPGKRPTVRRR